MGDVGRPRPWLLTKPVTMPTRPLSSGLAASECSTGEESAMGPAMGLAKGGGGVERAMGSAGVGGGVAGSGEG